MIAFHDCVKVIAAKSRVYDFGEIPPKDRKIIKKYAKIFLKELEDRKFPESDTAILMKYAQKIMEYL